MLRFTSHQEIVQEARHESLVSTMWTRVRVLPGRRRWADRDLRGLPRRPACLRAVRALRPARLQRVPRAAGRARRRPHALELLRLLQALPRAPLGPGPAAGERARAGGPG